MTNWNNELTLDSKYVSEPFKSFKNQKHKYYNNAHGIYYKKCIKQLIEDQCKENIDFMNFAGKTIDTYFKKRCSLHSVEEVRLEYLQKLKKGTQNVKDKIDLLNKLIEVNKEALEKKNEFLAVDRISDLKKLN